MATLTSRRISDTYPNLMQIEGGVTSTVSPVLDGVGNSSALSLGTLEADVNGKFKVLNISAGNVAILIKGASSQSANLQEWQNSSGTVLAKIDSSGQFQVGNTIIGSDFIQFVDANGGLWYGGAAVNLTAYNGHTLNIGTSTSGHGSFKAYIAINDDKVLVGVNNAVGSVPFTIKGAASQSANLQEWKNSSNTVLTSISAAGVITGNGSGITSINASNISSGTISNARLNSNVILSGANNSLLTNDSDYLTVASLGGIAISTFSNDAGYLTTISGLNISLLSNDSGYISGTTNISTFPNDAGYLTGVVLNSGTPSNMVGIVYGNGGTVEPDSNINTNGSGGLTVNGFVATPELAFGSGGTISGPTTISGQLTLSGIPTSDPLVTGRIWNDSGTLKISF